MVLIHKFVLLFVTTLALVLAYPTSDSSIGDILARTHGGISLSCGTHASQSAVAASQSNITLTASYSHKPRRIRIYWHVIYDFKMFERGYLTDDQIRKQVQVLNTHFRSADISFKLEKIDRTLNFGWFNWASDTDPYGVEMRESLHRGSRKDLNIYSFWGLNSDRGGYSTWPWNAKSEPKLDGVFLYWVTIPGGPVPEYNQGKVLVHQVGHWCGLFHTFEGGCTGPGDLVSDTPRQSLPNTGCPVGTTSCSGNVEDPIHNFMDYTDDSCKTHFTKGKLMTTRRHNDY
ncbi:hypothetical protein BDV93DRAFT_563075 [Ceratobasidium sp. AG-I]|nr:hypothetical protein BDV93DRAFT_563075 [Ceratobasidium sp. AG-I]